MRSRRGLQFVGVPAAHVAREVVRAPTLAGARHQEPVVVQAHLTHTTISLAHRRILMLTN